MKPGLWGAIIWCVCGIFSPLSAFAEKHVVILETMPVPVILESTRVLQETLTAISADKEQVVFEVLKAAGEETRAEDLLAKSLKRRTPDLVVAVATMASKVVSRQLQGTDVPWIFFIVTDPVGAELVAEVEQPSGTNVTGRVYGLSRASKLDLAFRLVSAVTKTRPIRIGYIHSTYPSSMADYAMLKVAVAADPNFTLVPVQLAYEPVPTALPSLLAKVRSAAADLKGQVDFWWSPIGPLGERDEYIRLLVEETDIPVLMATNLRGPENGALLYLGPDIPGQAREVAALASRVLEGEDPGTIPITMPKSFAVGLNLSVTNSLGIIVPSDFLDLAGDNIFR